MAKKILLVEDHQVMRQIVREMIAQNIPDATLLEAGNGQDAWRLFEEASPDLVLMDIGLPDSNGLSLVRRMKAARGQTSVIVLTNQEEKTYRNDAAAAGAVAYILKKNIHTQLLPLANELLRPNSRHVEIQARDICDGMRDAVFVEALDGRILDVNQAACEMYGYTREEFLSMKADKLVPDSANLVLPKSLEQPSVPTSPVETLNKRADGSVFPVEITTRLENLDGETIMLVVVRDISNRRTTEENLRLVTAALHAAANTVLITDKDGHILWVNPAFTQTTGYTVEEALGRTPRILQSGHQTPEFYQNLWETILGGNVWHGQIINKRKNGQEYVDATTITPLKNENGQITHFIAIKQDVTRQVQVRDTLEQHAARLSALHALDQAALAGKSESEIASIALKTLAPLIPFEHAIVMRYDFQRNEAGLLALHGKNPMGPSVQKKYDISLLAPPDLLRINNQPRCVPDLLEVASTLPGIQILQESGIRSTLNVPLIFDDTHIGSIQMGSSVPGKLTNEHLKIAEEIGKHLAIVLHNVRMAHIRDRQIKELRLRDAISAAVVAAQTTDDLLEQVTGLIAEALPVDLIGFLLWDKEASALYLHPSVRGIPDEMKGAHITRHGSVVSHVFNEGVARLIADTRQELNYMEVVPGMRSELCIPLQAKRTILGVLNAESRQVNAFSQEDLHLLTSVAELVTTALLKMQAHALIRQQAQDLKIIGEISSVLRQTQDLEQMAAVVLAQSARRLNAVWGAIDLVDAHHQELVTLGWYPPHSEFIGSRQKLDTGIAGKVVASGQNYYSPRLLDDQIAFFTPDNLQALQATGVRSTLTLPMKTTHNKTVGVIYIGLAEERRFTSAETRLLASIAEIASNTLQRTLISMGEKRQIERLETLRLIDQLIMNGFALPATLDMLLEKALPALGADAMAIWLQTPASHILELGAERGFTHPYPASAHLEISNTIAEDIIRQRKRVVIPDFSTFAQAQRLPTRLQQESFTSFVGIPLIVKEKTVGILGVLGREQLPADPDWYHFLEMLGSHAAIAVENKQLLAGMQRANLELNQAYDKTIAGWGQALELRDHETRNHTRRVTELTMKLAQLMGIDEEQLIHMRRGALLHDIGKIGVPDAILNKPGPLTKEEWAIMRRHPQLAHEMLYPIEFLRTAIDIPYCHHEKWDGSGYPRGLKGDEIPLAARIFAVADVWDALTSDRPYRKAWPRQKALRYIKDGAGTHFDPQVTTLFLRLINEKAE